ncbi:bifunctional proline dehydrogenase/L-glutamate gamma-semialdehyde dehydrogenase PutA [Glaciecola petra]|uniref:Bifunctional protein PutA n=1 Tax=Glaciecola petra TaxID=3075602 RepID=A0ABU2ZKZ9_9ALTE|nr:bifunctional proline dehydrogenase/L-glutamate gamma-semialdehyde dehydrogenase PutA [Aestuariibacter sp. P117]MDT0593297.1 bifunctional proline dehydrogenase/L-glutamate gamma-semialdehyde dehydrogenase PutA [Aestuariibacter sp. P117]
MLIAKNLATNSMFRQKIRNYYRIDEAQALEHILPEAEVSMRARSRAWERARNMVLTIRNDQESHGGVDALLHEYSLSTEEGIVLMCLAEALLRIPDKRTQEALIRDKLSKGQWSSHLGNSDSLFVNASAWGLMFTGNMVNYANERKKSQFGLLKKTMGRMGEPVIRKAMNIAMKVMGKQFVMGETIEDAVKRAQDKEKIGYVYSYDMLGEGARTAKDAARYYRSYEDAIKVIGEAAKGKGPRTSPGISVKLSAIHPRYDFLKHERVVPEISHKLKRLCLQAKKYDIGLTVDAEESERLDISLDVIERVFSDPELADWNGFGLAVQAYQKRAIFVIEWIRELTLNTNKKLMLRLVKGAYWDTEIKHTQQGGFEHFPVFTRKASTDVSYHACANRLLAYRDSIYPQFATHNAYTASVILELAGDDKEGFEFQCLHGMGDTLYDQIVKNDKIQCRIYAPVGHHEDLLAYLVRRLLENGANSSFVNAIVDHTKEVEELLTDPVEHTQRLANRQNTQITMPKDMFGDSRTNSKGFDLYDINKLNDLSSGVKRWFARQQKALQSVESQQPDFVVKNPSNLNEIIGHHHFDDEQAMLSKLEKAEKAFASWSQTPVAERAALLIRTADILERHMDELIGLCIKEAGKITQDGIDEVREAVDFCRYYAVEAEKIDPENRLAPRGVILCISPWNFPLAIFLGQVAAALVTGNAVIAKPAEQTSLIAQRAIALMQLVGLPEDAIQLVIAKGPEVGRVILPDERIQGVMFTGSTQTGTLISQILAERASTQVPLIAETGGQNCMIVDSTALPEQVVDDVIMSGFKSAGQRCSALRVLFLQEEIADSVIEMIKGAMKELSVGDPQWLTTDVGPVIDKKALNNLNEHKEYMQSLGQTLFECELPDEATEGTFFAPVLYEIEDISVLKKEVFGPCVHVVRFKGKELTSVIDKVNDTGFGLTMGIHTRIEERAYECAKLSRAGNIYINRNMIGAIVGVQPFGGRGLSGTGPKAGGPNYLPRLMMEKVTPDFGELSDEFADDHALASDNMAEQEVNEMLLNAISVTHEWRLTSLTSRLSAVRQLLAKIATVDIVDDLAEDLNQTLASARSQLIAIEKRLKKPLELPGPTGESNTLHLEPRGVLVTFADKEVTFEYWTLSIVTALATGNTVIAVVSDLFYEEALAFKDKFESTGQSKGVFQVARLKHLEALLEHKDIAGMVVDSNTSRTARFVQKMAMRQGAILPVITAEHNDNMIQRLLTEKTISIDTTASGGNTSLMTLTEDDD